MLLFPRNSSRNLCSLALACTMLATPVFASGQTDSGTEKPMSSMQSSYTSYQESVRQHYTETLTAAGYSYDETVFLLDTLPSYRLPTLLRYSYTPVIVEYVRQPHFTDTKLDRYLSHGLKHTSLTPAEVVTQVNIGLDRNFYTSVQMSNAPESLTVLVNKYNYLSSKFVPQLVSMDRRYTAYSGASMHPEAYQWFTKMADEAAAEGLWLYSVSAYRSYSYQNTLYTRYVNNNGKNLADTFSARPGYSEHQTGLAVDINVASSSAHFERTSEYRWLSEHAWEYGFILRYPQGKEHITGFRFEPWHYRYVGLDAAKEVYESGLTWEEYLMGPPITEDLSSPEISVDISDQLPAPDAESQITVPTEPDTHLPVDEALVTEDENLTVIPSEPDTQISDNEVLVAENEAQTAIATEPDTQLSAGKAPTEAETQITVPTESGIQQNHSHTVSGQHPTWPGVVIPRR